MIDKEKIKMNAPCGVYGDYPDILCAYKCVGCGFNPKEQRRRVKTGSFATIEYNGVKVRKLIFKRRAKNDDA